MPIRAKVLAVILVASVLILGGLSCSDSSKPKDDNSGTLLPDFSLKDYNRHSASYGQQVSPRDYTGDILMIFFGSFGCSTCRSQIVGIQQIITDLEGEGLTGVAGMMINPSWGLPDTSRIWLETDVELPGLQDLEEGDHDYAAQLLGCADDEMLIVDRQQKVRRKTLAYPAPVGEVDLSTTEGRATVEDWIREIDAGGQ